MDSVLINYIFHKITQLFHTVTTQSMYTSIKYKCTSDWQHAPRFYDNRKQIPCRHFSRLPVV